MNRPLVVTSLALLSLCFATIRAGAGAPGDEPLIGPVFRIVLGSFPRSDATPGPDKRLASELLKRGEREVVLEYFDLCATFWRSDRLDEWAAVVKASGMPDFRFNPVGYR